MLTEKQIDFLKDVEKQSKETGFCYKMVTENIKKELFKYLDFDEKAKKNGIPAVRLSALGVQAVSTTGPVETVETGFEIDENVPIPEKIEGKRRGRAEKYPFGKLSVGQSFWTTDSLQKIKSAVYSKNKKIGSKKFEAHAVGLDDPRGEGVRVYCVSE